MDTYSGFAGTGRAIDELTAEVKRLTAANRTNTQAFDRVSSQLADARQQVANGAADAHGSALSSTINGGLRALGQPGAGGVDALQGAVSGLSSALPQLGAAIGMLAGGPVGALVGGAVGTLGSAAVERTVGIGMRARDSAISEVSGMTASRAAAGMQIPPQAMAALLEGSMIRARRVGENEAAVRATSNSMSSLQRMFGSAS